MSESGAATGPGTGADLLELEKTLERYRVLVESASDVVFLAGPDRRIVWIAPSVTATLGWDPEELVGTRIADLLRPDAKIATEQDRMEFYARGHDVNPEGGYLLELRTKSGGYRWMTGRGHALTGPEGSHAGLVAGLRDVTDLIEARREAQTQRATLRAALDSQIDPRVLGEAVRDEAGRIVDLVYTYANPAACASLDRDYADLMGARMREHHPGHVWAVPFEQFAQVVETGGPLILERVPCKQGPMQVEHRYDVRATRVGDGLSVTWRDVTEQYEADKHANRMAGVVEQTHDAMIGASYPEGVLTDWNPAAERMYGYTAAEITGKPLFVLTPKHLLEQSQGLLTQLAAGEPVVDFRTLRIRKDGTEIPVSVSSSPIRDAEGVIVGFFTIHRDITHEMQAREYANRLAAIVEHSSDAIISGSLDGTITSWNKTAERMFGYTAEEAIGTHFESKLPADRVEAAEVMINQVRAGQLVQNRETEGVRKDGTAIPVTVTVSPLVGDDDAIVGLSAIFCDLTEKVRAERALAEVNRKFRLLAENASDVVFLASPDRRVVWIAPSVTAALGWDPEELVGTRMSDLLFPEDRIGTEQLIVELYDQGHDVHPEGGHLFRMRTKSGDYRWLSGYAHALTDPDGTPAGAVAGMHDVTDLVTARQEARELSNSLEILNDSLRTFIAIAAHDLRAPLVTIAGFTEMLTDDWALSSDEDRLNQLDAIRRGVSRLTRLTADLLASARLEEGAEQTQPENIPVATALASYLEASRDELGDVAVTCAPELVAVVDRSHLTRILDNYLSNAFKYGEPPIHVEAGRAGDFVEIRVRDNGPGVPAESVSRLFTKFDRGVTPVARETTGTGLGLSIVKALAEANGGDVEYEPGDPAGGCFIVRLPAAA